MGNPTEVQLIACNDRQPFYINIPAPRWREPQSIVIRRIGDPPGRAANRVIRPQAMDFTKGEVVEWAVAGKLPLIVSRTVVPVPREMPPARAGSPFPNPSPKTRA